VKLGEPDARRLHHVACQAQSCRTLQQVRAEFGRRDLPDYHLVVRLQRRYGAEVTYGPSDTVR
jgi:hypothetical protein